MRIIKEGNLDKLKNPVEFECSRCGCVFEATDDEYTIDGRYATYKCPCCEHWVTKRLDK